VPKQPLPTLEAVTNFRELGGLPGHAGGRVRTRRLLRSGHWGGATAQDIAHLETLGVETVFDFRSDDDIAVEGPDKLPTGTELVRLRASDPAGAVDLRSLIQESGPEALHEHLGDGRGAELMRSAAARLVVERTALYREFLHRLAERHAPPALFHCSAGKDRAGWAASVVLLALGVDEGDVREHYLLSNVHYRPRSHHGLRTEMPAELIELLGPLVRVAPEYIEASLGAARDEFGSVAGYLHEGLDMTEPKRKQLRANWLD
jgi:protein-tyrosine phosphatase